MLKRIPDYFVRLYFKHQLTRANYFRSQPNNYRVFNAFCPGVIANYNHDGLAERLCTGVHRVLSMHGTINPGYGSPRIERFLCKARDYHLLNPPDGLLMGVPESFFDPGLARRLIEIGSFSAKFVAVIGYSFARYGSHHDDQVSLDYFQSRFKNFVGRVYIIDPDPEYLREILGTALRHARVMGIRSRWNVLARAFLQKRADPCDDRSLNYLHEQILDMYGGG
jgi:hypothetical protein